MPNIIDEKYLIASMIDMVGAEIIRLSSNNLISPQEINSTANIVNDIVKNALKSEEALALRDLIKLHKHLSKIKLPGDSVQISARLGDLFNITVSMVGKEKEEPAKTEEKKQELEDDAEDKKFELIKIETLAKLEKIAYDLGTKGNHEAAFLVEKHIHTIKDILK